MIVMCSCCDQECSICFQLKLMILTMQSYFFYISLKFDLVTVDISPLSLSYRIAVSSLYTVTLSTEKISMRHNFITKDSASSSSSATISVSSDSGEQRLRNSVRMYSGNTASSSPKYSIILRSTQFLIESSNTYNTNI